ncbi:MULTISPECIES: hypothetical protein [unclassified Brevundimonas]|uniref:hypothetical protein n=1 Tax=unclassified Brevundimonas TaxID=2622653 RepID=UPI0025C62D79|nr:MULTISPECIES: hypothetical protein [unclassified Brevundimonas]
MADLRKTPSVQHAVALIRPTVEATLLEMEKLDAAKIPFSLNPSRKLFKPLMEGCTLDWALRQIEAEKHLKNIAPNKDLTTAFFHYASSKKVSWFREPEPFMYPIGSGVMIPVRPSGFWVEDGRLQVLWAQSWKGRTLDPLQKAIFNTILQQTFFVGDFKDAGLEWVDLSEKHPRAGREVEILDSASLGTVTHAELNEALGILLEAFEIHAQRKAARKAADKGERKPKDRGPDLFDFPEPK